MLLGNVPRHLVEFGARVGYRDTSIHGVGHFPGLGQRYSPRHRVRNLHGVSVIHDLRAVDDLLLRARDPDAFADLNGGAVNFHNAAFARHKFFLLCGLTRRLPASRLLNTF